MADIGTTPVPSTPGTPAQSQPGGDQNTSPQSQGVKHVDATPSKTQANPEVFEVKVNGKIVKMSRQEALDRASMSEAAHQKFNEAKQTRAEVDRIINSAKKNPIEALMDPALGLTKDQIRQAFETWYSKEYIEPETLTPEQRKLKEYEAKVRDYEEQAKLAKEKSDQDQLTELTSKQKEFIQGQIIEALDSSGLPKTKFFASRMAFYMRQNAMNGWDAPISMIVQQVKNERQSMMTDVSEGATVEQLISMLGEGVINKIRQHDLKQLREKRNIAAPVTQSPQRNTERRSSSWADVQKSLNDIKRGKLTW